MAASDPRMSDGEQSAAQAWLIERMRPGNWLDIAPGEDIHPEITGWNRTLLHMHQLSFSPEIRRRKEFGTLPTDFALWAAQLIQPHEGGQIIRLNEEVRGVPYLRTTRPVEKGEKILLSDLANLEIFDLDEDELDSGHFTIFWTGEVWTGSFDFRSGRAKCVALIEKALTFLAATRLAIANQLAEPAIDNLHTACENIAKTRLILDHKPAHKWKSHGMVMAEINRMGRMGNVDAAFLDTFNRVSRIRSAAKYATGYDAKLPDPEELDLVETMALALQQSVESKRPDSVSSGDETVSHNSISC
jgi:hypothetical protein